MPVKVYKVHGREGFVAMFAAEAGGRERVVGGVERHGEGWGVFVPADTHEPLESGFTSATAAKAYMAGLFKGVELAASGSAAFGGLDLRSRGPVPADQASGISADLPETGVVTNLQEETHQASQGAKHKPRAAENPNTPRPMGVSPSDDPEAA